MVISFDIEKIFGKIKHPYMLKILKDLGKQGTYLNIKRQLTNL